MTASGKGRHVSTALQFIHELRLFCNNGPRKTQDTSHGSDDEILSHLVQLEENVCASCSISIFCIDRVEGRDGGLFIHPCGHLVCHSCWPQCVEKKKEDHCRLCANGHAPTDLAVHSNTDNPAFAAEAAAETYPSKLLALLKDIKHVSGEKW